MSIISFIIPTFLGFYLIYKSIKSLDKIDRIKNNGIRKKAIVSKIREEVHNSGFDEDGFSSTTHEYFYTVKFNDKNGREIEKELEFSVNKKESRSPPFSIDIIYIINENSEIEVIFENNKKINTQFYLLFIFGTIVLSTVIFNYKGEADLIIEFIKIFLNEKNNYY